MKKMYFTAQRNPFGKYDRNFWDDGQGLPKNARESVSCQVWIFYFIK